jgi:hypothetical protein
VFALQETRGQPPQFVIDDWQETIQRDPALVAAAANLLQQQSHFVRHKSLEPIVSQLSRSVMAERFKGR